MTNIQKDKQGEIQELQKQNQYLLQNINELREHVVNLSGGFTMLQQKNTHKEQQWVQQQNDITQRLTSLQQAIPPHSSQAKAEVVLAPTTAAQGALQPNQDLEESNAAGLTPLPTPTSWSKAQAQERQRPADTSGRPGAAGVPRGPADLSHSSKWQEWGEQNFWERRDTLLHTPRNDCWSL
jgi:hypothetical protein